MLRLRKAEKRISVGVPRVRDSAHGRAAVNAIYMSEVRYSEGAMAHLPRHSIVMSFQARRRRGAREREATRRNSASEIMHAHSDRAVLDE